MKLGQAIEIDMSNIFRKNLHDLEVIPKFWLFLIYHQPPIYYNWSNTKYDEFVLFFTLLKVCNEAIKKNLLHLPKENFFFFPVEKFIHYTLQAENSFLAEFFNT